MNMNSKMAILHTYGSIVRVDLLDSPVGLWLLNNASQRSCDGKGSSLEAAVDDLYMVARTMMFSCVRNL